MKLWEITLPKLTNELEPYDRSHAQFRHYLLATFGGYTAFDVAGGWTEKGRLYEEDNTIYRVASNAAAGGLMVAEAATLFPDQVAFFWALIGEGHVIHAKGAGGGRDV